MQPSHAGCSHGHGHGRSKLILCLGGPAPPRQPAGRPRLIIDNPGPAARPRAHTEIIGVNTHDPRVLAPPPPKARGHGARLWLCWHCVPRDHRTHTLPERHCKQAMLARGRWQATFTRDTTVLLPRSCTGFFLQASMPSNQPSPILLARCPWGAA